MNDTCRDTIASLDAYLEHTLPPAQRAVVDGHLHRCPYCTDYLGMYRDTIRLCRAVAGPASDPAEWPDGSDRLGELDESSLHLVEAILRKVSRPS